MDGRWDGGINTLHGVHLYTVVLARYFLPMSMCL